METCMHCGKTWGVLTPPRSPIACSECLGRPDLYPVRYWWARHRIRGFFTWPVLRYRTVDYWDNQCSMEDLAYAADLAEQVWGGESR